MAPKKKGAKKQADDWENELGETPTAVNTQEQQAESGEAKNEAEVNPEEEFGGGGLLAALKKNKTKKAKKGKPVDDFVEGEDPPSFNGVETTPALTDTKDPQEATFEDGDTVAKLAGGKKSFPSAARDDADDDVDEGGKLMSKKEKEREKKEREKQRKREQVCQI